MVKKLHKQVRAGASGVLSRAKVPEVSEEEQILRAATRFLLQKHGMFLIATGTRETRIKGFRVWVITVTLRYTTGHEGYVGDLLYDGEEFTFLTEPALMDERIRKVAENPERLQKWNECRSAPSHPGKG